VQAVNATLRWAADVAERLQDGEYTQSGEREREGTGLDMFGDDGVMVLMVPAELYLK